MENIVNMMIKGDSIFLGTDVQAPAVSVIARGALKAATTNAAGGVLTLQNTTGYDLYVKHVILDVTTKSTGVATLAVGTADTVASATNLIAAADVSTAAAVIANTGSGKIARWSNGKYLTVTASATTAGMVGTYVLECTPA